MTPPCPCYRTQIEGAPNQSPWSVVDGLILFKGRVYVAATSSVILELVHGARHEGVHKMLHRLRADFHFPGDRKVV